MKTNPEQYYVLDQTTGRIPVQEESFVKWRYWMNDNARRNTIGLTNASDGKTTIRTEFLGVDANKGVAHPPLFFATFLIKDRDLVKLFRYSTWEQAEAGHNRQVEKFNQPDRPSYRTFPTEHGHMIMLNPPQ